MIHNPTIIDIARELGISKSTVSRALAGHPGVNENTRRIILEKAASMHYRPNYMARNLTKSRTRIIGVVVPEFINSFFPRIIIQIQNLFEREHFRVLITQCDNSWETERKNLKLMEDAMVEGILISVTSKGKNTDYYNELIRKGTPLVFFNRNDSAVEASSVTIDDYKWSFFATEHLIYTRKRMGQQFPRIMHFRGPAGIDLARSRYRGYADALAKHHLDSSPELTVTVNDNSKEEGFRQMSYLIETGALPDALFCFSDQLAIGAMRALLKNGISIPQTVSVMGFSESQSALVTVPALSSVAQPLEEMGRTAARILMDEIEDPSVRPRSIILNAILNVRGSSDPDKSPL